MSKTMLAIVDLQNFRAHQNAERAAKGLPPVLCRWERDKGNPCNISPHDTNCQACAAEFVKARDEEKEASHANP